MQYRRFGKLEWQASILGFGCMRLPVENGNTEQIDELAATSMLLEGIERGINYLDTAYTYHGGQSEPFVGRALSTGYRHQVHLATKMPTWLIQSAADFDRYLNEQLTRLQTDHIDHYLLHGLHKQRWTNLRDLGVREWAQKAIASGRIGQIGFSFHDNNSIFHQIIDEYDGWDFCQIQYNYMDINEQAGEGGLRYAASKGLAVVVMEPLLGGKLATPPESVQAIFDASGIQRAPAEWALQWLWNQTEVTVALSGMSLPEQVRENLGSADRARIGGMSDAELGVIAAAREKYNEICPIPCTKCGYCMPCPNGVDIPRNFEVFNKGAMISNWGSARFRYGQIPPGERAEVCLDCDECEDKCPQHILISDWMPYLHQVLGNKLEHDGRRGINPV